MNLLTLSAQRRRIGDSRSPDDAMSPESNNKDGRGYLQLNQEQLMDQEANETGQFQSHQPSRDIRNRDLPQQLASKEQQDPQNHYLTAGLRGAGSPGAQQ
jgi:hypothetical protein